MSTTPRHLLSEAQNAIAKGDIPGAISAFSVLIDLADKNPASDFNPALAVLSRASCHMQMKNYALALQDALKAIKLKNIKSNQELYPGCYSSRAAAASYCADASKGLNNREDFAVYKRMATELMKGDAGNVEAAQALKDQGNALFREGKLEEALTVYKDALVKDSTNTAVLANASLVLVKLGKGEIALEMAERCVALKPNWSKGWYRKGNALLHLNQPAEAAQSFQQGLQLTPDDADLKQAYMEAVQRAKIAPQPISSSAPREPSVEDTTHAKKMMGMMMDLRYNSWDIEAFFSKTPGPTRIDFSTWDVEVSPLLSNANVQQNVYELIKLAYPSFKKGGTPVGLNPYLSSKSTPTSWHSHILPDHPLLSAFLLLHLLTTSETAATSILLKKTWTVAFTHQADPTLFLGTALYPHIQTHKTYAVLVSRAEGEVECVLDFLAEWCADADGTKNEGFMQNVVGKAGKEGSVGEKVVVYTCDEWGKGREYVEGYYRGLNGGGKAKSGEEGKEKGIKKEVSFELSEKEEESDEEETNAFAGGKVTTMNNILKPKRRSGGLVGKYCGGCLEKEAVVDVMIGVGLAVVGAGICIMYL
ncbi:hypothetical protein HDU98_009350 [Podochytrium sp. JEL0797]|nr:hypothetical protein HDU98_009350 [Podochytrium sp. JEL0797]